MKIKTLITETEKNILVLRDIFDIATEFEDANFWLQRKGSITTVGKPIRGSENYDPENIGLGIKRPDKYHPDYMYYVMLDVYTSGHWQKVSKGVLNLQNITVSDVKSFSIQAYYENK